ncbi:hypothetical protein E2C01_088581 [Portunus trituberculatus]|uniref:Uncharacterized protein n=1 Tax=Portunus trituberculatus TaxID=210409 RepID=A0A5B7JM98_PORTR|nr:hypothetical protein [Portunus trituberculatus]
MAYEVSGVPVHYAVSGIIWAAYTLRHCPPAVSYITPVSLHHHPCRHTTQHQPHPSMVPQIRPITAADRAQHCTDSK